MGEAGGFRQVLIVKEKRRRDRRIENFKLVAEDFDGTAAQIRVVGALGAAPYTTGDTHAEFIADPLGDLEHVGPVGVADHLRNAFAVTQVDEDDPAVVTATVHPAKQGDGLVEAVG